MIEHTSSKVTSALFQDLRHARRAVESLRRHGIPDKTISLLSSGEHYPEQTYQKVDEDVLKEAETAEERGTEAGVALGGAGGFLLGIALVSVPGVGPVLAVGGVLSSTLAGAAVGGLTGGLISTLARFGIPEEEAREYEEGIKQGRALVVVQTEAEKAGQASEILEDYGPLRVRDRHEVFVS